MGTCQNILLSFKLVSTDSSFLYKSTKVAKSDCTLRGVVVQEVVVIVEILAAFFFILFLSSCFLLKQHLSKYPPTLWFFRNLKNVQELTV